MTTLRSLALAALLTTAACGASSPRASVETVAGAPNPAGAGAAVTAPGGGRVVIGSSPRSPSPTTTGAEATPAAAAHQAIDGWLDALVRRDPAAMLDASTGGPAALGSISLVAQQVIATRGGTTGVQVSSEHLTTSGAAADSVEFAGEIDLRSTITGPKGTATSTDRLTGPIRIVKRNNSWKVASVVFDGMPLVYYPQGVSQTMNGLHLTVAFVLSYGTNTTALVDVHSDASNATVTLQHLVLTTAGGAKLTGNGSFPAHSPTGLFGFARTTDSPAHLNATFQQRGGPTITFSLDLPARAG